MGRAPVINAALANIDGRGCLKYFLASLIIGPFATVLLARTYEEGGGNRRQVDLWKGRAPARPAQEREVVRADS